MENDEVPLPISESPLQPNTVSLSNVSLESATEFPIDINFRQKLSWFATLGYIKYKGAKLKQQFLNCFVSRQNIAYVRVMFWYFLFLKLPIIGYKNHPNREIAVEHLREQLRAELSRTYVELFLSIPAPKDRAINLITFTNVFFIIKMYNETFRSEQMEMLVNSRFIIDNFHIAIFESLGMEVSERFIQQNMDEMFNDFWNNIPAEYQKKNKLKEQNIKKQKKLKEDKQTDFFEGRVAKTSPQNEEQERFLKDLEDLMYVEKQTSKRKRRSSFKGAPRFMGGRRQSRGNMGATKSSFNNELKTAQRVVMRRKIQQQQKKYEQQSRKFQFLNKLEQMQTTKSTTILQTKSGNTRQIMSVARLGPCVTSFLNLKLNNIPETKPKFINHPQQKVLTNDYLRKLLADTIVHELPPEEPIIQSKTIDISKPLRDVSLMEIPSYRKLGERALKRMLEPPKFTERTLNPEKDELKLPKVDGKERFRRPEILADQKEQHVDQIFINAKYTVEVEVPQEYRQVRYKNNLGKYKRSYKS